MARTAQARRLIRAALEIRAAQAHTADTPPLRRAEVRLREELGGSVPKSVAAEALGVSLTALERWVAARRVPAVQRRGGREEIAADALVDLATATAPLRTAGVRRGILSQALRALAAEGLPRPRLRPNESADELWAAYRATTPVERLREAAELSLAATTLAAYGAVGRA
jgi:hypothetical protein